MTKFKLNMKHVEMLTKYKTFDDYLKYMEVDVFTLGNPSQNGGHSARRNIIGLENDHRMA